MVSPQFSFLENSAAIYLQEISVMLKWFMEAGNADKHTVHPSDSIEGKQTDGGIFTVRCQTPCSARTACVSRLERPH